MTAMGSRNTRRPANESACPKCVRYGGCSSRLEISTLLEIAVVGEALGPRCTAGGASGGGTRRTGPPEVFVLEVRLGLSGVIARLEVVVGELRPKPLWALPLLVLPDVPIRVPTPDPPAPDDDVGVGANTGALPKNTIWIWFSPPICSELNLDRLVAGGVVI